MWFELDSMDDRASREAPLMLDEDWANLRGDFYFAAAVNGNAYSTSLDLGWCPVAERLPHTDDITTLPLVN
jgi:hypothetical protein